MEKQVERLWLAVWALALGLLLVTTLHFTQSPTGSNPSTVRAERFELVDSAGNIRASLDVDIGGAWLQFRAADGTGRLVLWDAGDEGAGLSIYDHRERRRIGLQYSPTNGGMLGFQDAAGRVEGVLP